MPNSPRSLLLRYGGAVVAVVLGTAARRVLDPVLGALFPFATLFPAVLIVAALAGRGPALLAVGLSAAASARFLLPPRDRFWVEGSDHQVGFALYLIAATGMALLGGMLREARRRAEAEAEGAVRQRERMRITLESVGDAVIVADAEGRVASLNPVAETLTGWPSAEAAGRPLTSVFRIFDEETGVQAVNPALRALDEGSISGVASHTALIARDGTSRPIDDSASPIRDRSGAIIGAVVVFRDISERRRAEAEVRHAGDRARAILASITDGFCSLDRDWRFTYVNPMAEALLGRPAADLLGKSHWEEYPGTLGTAFERNYHRAVAEQAAVAFREYFEPHDRWYEIHAYPSPEGLSVYFRDISDRVLAEERERRLRAEAAEADAKFRAFFEQGVLFAGIMAVDGTILEVNRLALEATGFTKDQVIGHRFWEGPWWAGSVELADQIREGSLRAAEGRTFRAELPYWTADGEERLVDWIIMPIKDEAGRVAFLAPTGTDITDRKWADVALQQSEAWFRHLADALPQIVWISEPDGAVEFYNERWYEYTGLTAEESYSLDGWMAAIHPDDLDRLVEASTRATTLGEPFEAEFRLRHHGGAYRWQLGRSVEVLDEVGRVVRRFGTTTDIDDRKRVERDARFLAEASAALASVDDEAETLRKVAYLAVPHFADWCTVDLMGEDRVPDRLAVAHVDPEKVELAEELRRRYPPGSGASEGVAQVIRSGHSRIVPEITVEMLEASIADPDYLRTIRELGLRSYLCVPVPGRTRILGAITFVAAESGRRYDRDDLRLAEDLAARAAIALENARLFRELKESEERFRQLADAMPQIVYTASPDGEVDYFNRRWYESAGRLQGEGGHDWTPRIHPDDLQATLDRWRESIASGRRYELEFRLLDERTAAHRWHLGRALPVLDESGRVVKWFGTATDIDDRKQAEVALGAARDEAEEANRAKTQFMAVLSHELRTPLNPILLATSSMLDRPWDSNDVRPTLEMIRRNVNLQARLIDDLLDVTRIVRGKMPLQSEIADCHALIDDALQICRGDLALAGLRLDVDLAARHHHIAADPARWQQVLWNLVKNAVKFTPGGGSIAIRTRNEPGESGGGERLVIEVADTGIGIAADVLPRIFDPFQQGETTITRRFGGLGLGLAISRGIVEGHGGAIVAESGGEGRGTTLRVVIPALGGPNDEVGGRPEGRSNRGEPTRPHRVLVVEDEPTTLKLMARLLAGLGHEVTTAATLAEAIERAEAEAGDFGLIVSDIGLPDGSGLDLMRRVVARWGRIPAIALTGYGMEEDIRRSREAGFATHMTKPIDFSRLEATIRIVAAGGEVRDGNPPA